MNSEDEKSTVKPKNNIYSEEDLQSIHDMITEALLCHTTSPSTTAQQTNIDPQFLQDHGHQITDQDNLIYVTDSGEEITLRKLFLQFKNLDFRLSRVEEVIQTHDENAVKKRAHMARSNYTNPCFETESSSSSPSRLNGEISSINPILTSSNDMLLSMEFNQNSSAFSLPSISKSKVKRKDEIKRSELDHYCIPLLEYEPKPTTEQLIEIVSSLKPVYPNVNTKQLLSKVREWFRKRREYMSQRIFQACSETFKDLTIETETELEEQISNLDRNSGLVKTILRVADLEIINESTAKEYCHEKIIAYFNSLYKPLKGRIPN